MVASTIQLPNVRRLFVPDPGKLIGECDLSGADAQVVAWEAEDEDLKAAFRAGLKVHIKNVRDVFPGKVKGWSDEAIKATDHPGGIYHNNKRMVHGTNYGGTPRGMAGRIGVTVKEVDDFQKNWFGIHPGIKLWQDRTQAQLEGRRKGFPPRSVSNQFGYRIFFFDRIQGLLPEALAWTPQSTVGINCSKGAVLAENSKLVEVLLQVHDSFIFQMDDDSEVERKLRELNKLLHSVKVPYSDPLTIPWKLNLGNTNWGDAPERSWPG